VDERVARTDELDESRELSTEQMIALLTEPTAAEYAYRVARTYESVERIYNASLNIGTFSSSAATTNSQ
jgi:hypothetical protein